MNYEEDYFEGADYSRDPRWQNDRNSGVLFSSGLREGEESFVENEEETESTEETESKVFMQSYVDECDTREKKEKTIPDAGLIDNTMLFFFEV